MKKISNIILSIFFLFSMIIFASTPKKTINVGVPKAPPALPILRMIDSNALGDEYNVELKIWTSPEILIGMVQSKEADFFAYPLTVVSKLYNKGMDVKLTNVNTWGVASFVSSDTSVKDWKDLKGKTIYLALKSSPPDVFTKFFLDKNGLKEKEDYEIIYVSNKQELANLLITEKAKYATIIEPEVTAVKMKNNKIKTIISFEKEWQKLKNDNNAHIPTAGFGIIGETEKRDVELVKKFEIEYEKALKWVVKNPKLAGQLAEEKLGLNAKIVENAIPNMGLKYMNAKDSKKILDEYYKILKDYDPKTIGGNIPDENFYFNK